MRCDETTRLIEAYIAQPEQAAVITPLGLDELSPRELEVLGLVARGSNNREIADALYLSPLTVKTRSEERRVGKECRSRWSPYH